MKRETREETGVVWGVQCRWKGRDWGRAEGEEGRDVGEREGRMNE